MRTETPSKLPMTCPVCSSAVRFFDLKSGRCQACSTKICLPKRYYRVHGLLALIVTIVFVVETFSTVLTSPASFSRVMLWLLMICVINLSSFLLFLIVSFRMFPPVVERLYANDEIIVLRLDE